MKRIVPVGLLVFVASLLGAQAAFGCSCAPERDAREDLDNADAAIFGEVLERRVQGERALYRVRVIETFKGDVGGEVEIDTHAMGATCGLELDVGEQSGLLLRRRDGGWSSGLCDQRTREHLRRGVFAPRPQSAGPIRILTAGEFGPERVAGLDARGRLVRLGAGEGETVELAACPGGRRTVEVVHRPGVGWSFGVRDVASMKVLRTVGLDLQAERWHEQPNDLRCDSRDGRLAQIAVAGQDRTRVLSVTGGAYKTTWRADDQSQTTRFGRRYGWAVIGGRLLRIDPRTGATRDLGERAARERVVSVSPDERRLIIAPVAEYGKPTRVSLLDARTGTALRSTQVEYIEGAYWLGRRSLVLWVHDGLRFVDHRLRVRRTVKDGVPGLLSLGAVHGTRLLTVSGSELRRYDRAGRRVGRVQRLFSPGVRALEVLPRPPRSRARAGAVRACAWRGLRPAAIA